MSASERDDLIAQSLVAWFRSHARDLPWRRTRDPYAIWLSEIMLQQTRVDTVVPYYQKFISRFPTVRSLSEAPLDDVLALWSGLGYYRRARQLHLAAREVTERYGGHIPRSAADLRDLRGIGPYTAGAIASIAFDEREALVDGNVARVLARVEGIDDDIRSGSGLRTIWDTARRLVPKREAGIFNQALMELGATICVPRVPHCARCPVDGLCVAKLEARTSELPVVSPKKKSPIVRLIAIVVRKGEAVLLARRRTEGLFGGMWEPPMVETTRVERATRMLRALGVDVTATSLKKQGNVRHVLTHRTLDVRVLATSVAGMSALGRVNADPYDEARWVKLPCDRLGISTLSKKVIRIQKPESPSRD